MANEEETTRLLEDLGIYTYQYTADIDHNSDVLNEFLCRRDDEGIGETSDKEKPICKEGLKETGTGTSEPQLELSIDEWESTEKLLWSVGETTAKTSGTFESSGDVKGLQTDPRIEENEEYNNGLAQPLEPDPEVLSERAYRSFIYRTEVPPKETSDCTAMVTIPPQLSVIGTGDVIGPQIDPRIEEEISSNGLIVEQPLEPDPEVVSETFRKSSSCRTELPPKESPNCSTIVTIHCSQLSVIETEASSHDTGNTTHTKRGTKRKSGADLAIQDNRTSNNKIPLYKMEPTGDKDFDARIKKAKNTENARQRGKEKIQDLKNVIVQKDETIADLKAERDQAIAERDQARAERDQVLAKRIR